MKRCSNCKKIKNLDKFHTSKIEKGGYIYSCKICRNKRSKQHREANKDKISKQKKQHREDLYIEGLCSNGDGNKLITKRNCANCLEKYMKRQYGINFKQYHILIQKQNNKCAICKIKINISMISRGKGMCIDHDHKTGNIRGILCSVCNRGLGHFRDNPKLLNFAITYLEKH